MSMCHARYWRDKFLGCLGVTLVVFALPYLMPGPTLALYGGSSEDEQRQQHLVAFYALDRSLPAQYGVWLYRMASGQWGDSRYYNRSVGSDARRAMFQTSMLIAWTILVITCWIWLWPRLCHWRRSPRLPRSPGAALWLLALPNFVVVILMRDILLWRFGWLSMAHMPAFAPLYLFNPIYMIVPAALLALAPCALWTTVSPQSTFGKPLGVSKSLAHFCRRCRPLLAGMLLELLLLEQILSLPGLGRLGFAALKRRDVPILQGFLLCAIILYFALGLLLDWGAKRRRQPHPWRALAGPVISSRVVPRRPMPHMRRYQGMLGLLLLLAITIWTPQLSPYDPGEIHSDDQLLRIGYRYFLGTDFLGRDVLSRALGACRTELPRSWLIMIVAGASSGILLALGRRLPRQLSPLLRAGAIVYHMLPPFLAIFLLFLILAPLPWAMELSLLLGLLPSTLHLLSRRRPLAERVLNLAHIGGEALLLLVIFHFLNFVPDIAAPTWGSDLRMGIRYSQNNAWLLAGPSVILLWAYYSFYITGLGRSAAPRNTETR